MAEETQEAAVAATGEVETESAPPADIEGYRTLVEKLREENKSLKSDRTPQDEKDARAIAALRRQIKDGDPNAKAQAAEEARAAMAQEIGKALGLIKDDEPADPVKLTEQLTAAGADARQAKLELAVYRAAQATDADPNALLDSRVFLAKLADVDPSDTAAVTAAITEAVTANPRLGKVEAPTPGMRPNPAQGRSASAPLGLAEQIAAAEKAGDAKATIRLKAAMALNNSN